MGFEPTRGDPIGLAGRRLSRSAKVSVDQGQHAQTQQLMARCKTPTAKRDSSPHSGTAPLQSVLCGNQYLPGQGHAAGPRRSLARQSDVSAALDENDTCEIRAHAGRPHRLSRPTP